jgi:uncharacterized membrane protein YfcA
MEANQTVVDSDVERVGGVASFPPAEEATSAASQFQDALDHRVKCRRGRAKISGPKIPGQRRDSGSGPVLSGVTLTNFLLASAVMATGSAVQGAVGFGLALFAAPILALIDPHLAPGPLLVANVALTAFMARRESHAIRRPDLVWSLGGRVVGIGIALLVMRALSPRGIDLLFGGIVLAGVAMTAGGLRFELNPGTLLGAGLTSGVMGTATAIGGPPMALVYQRETGPRIRGTLSAYFTIGAVLSAIGLALAGRFGTAELRDGLLLCPGVVLGFLASDRFLPLVDRNGIQPALLIISAVAALVLIGRHFI